MAYFLISVSNKTNLDLCIKYGLAGFTNSINGAWTFIEINKNDYISFLYGAKVFNLYKVIEKKAIKNARNIGPWPPVTFSMSGRTYYFPFRLYLEPIREFTESMIKPEFSFVAENLLLRGGYRRTHFQADNITFHSVSQMGEVWKKEKEIEKFEDDFSIFDPLFTFNRKKSQPPEVFLFQELILQSLIRQYLSDQNNLQKLFVSARLNNLSTQDFEVLGEKAFPEGHVDILIKEHSPQGICKKIIVEIKTGRLQRKHIQQILGYMKELGEECIKGILIGKEVSSNVLKEAEDKNINCFTYSFDNLDMEKNYKFEELLTSLSIF